jgi:hypothetical protein
LQLKCRLQPHGRLHACMQLSGNRAIGDQKELFGVIKRKLFRIDRLKNLVVMRSTKAWKRRSLVPPYLFKGAFWLPVTNTHFEFIDMVIVGDERDGRCVLNRVGIDGRLRARQRRFKTLLEPKLHGLKKVSDTGFISRQDTPHLLEIGGLLSHRAENHCRQYRLVRYLETDRQSGSTSLPIATLT